MIPTAPKTFSEQSEGILSTAKSPFVKFFFETLKKIVYEV